MSKRIHWAFDGTVASSIETSAKYALTTNQKYFLDGDQYSLDMFGVTNREYFIFNFPDTLLLDKFAFRRSPDGTSYWAYIQAWVSTNSTDGFDGTWTEVLAQTAYATTDITYRTFSFTPINATWLKIKPPQAYSDLIYHSRSIHIFGEYQAPRFEFWDTTETTKFTANYPLDMADAPNYADYNGSISFKLKNVDSSTHSYMFDLNPIKWNDTLDITKDSTINNYFQITKSGLPTNVSDTFTGSDGTAPDTAKWLRTLISGDTCQISGNKLYLVSAVGGTYIRSMYRLSGNFDIQIDFSTLVTDSINGNYFEFDLDSPELIKDNVILKAGYDGGNKFASNYRLAGTWGTEVTVSRTNDYGGLRIIRSGTSVNLQYKDGAGSWVDWRTFTMTSDDWFVRITMYRASGTPSVYADNFTINTVTPATEIAWDKILMDGILAGAFTPTITVSAVVAIANNPADGYHQFAVDVIEYA